MITILGLFFVVVVTVGVDSQHSAVAAASSAGHAGRLLV